MLFYSIPFPINLIHTPKPMKDHCDYFFIFLLIFYTIPLCTRMVSFSIRTLLIPPMQVQQHRPPRGRSAWIRGRGVHPSPATVSVQLGTHPQPTCTDLKDQSLPQPQHPHRSSVLAGRGIQESAATPHQHLPRSNFTNSSNLK